MELIEIIILTVGIILVAVTYILSEKFEMGGRELEEELSGSTRKIAEELVRAEVNRELAEVIDEKLEAVSVELDKTANEKILAVGSYSDEVLERIEKNHNEVMFLYNMLNEKEAALKDTIRDIEALKLSVKKMALANDIAGDAGSRDTESRGTELHQETANVIPAKKSSSAKQDLHISAAGDGTATPEADNVRSRSREKSNKNGDILRLHESGSSNMEIAKKLGIGIGEVRLVIDLFKKEV